MGRPPLRVTMPVWLFERFVETDETTMWRWLRANDDTQPARELCPQALGTRLAQTATRVARTPSRSTTPGTRPCVTTTLVCGPVTGALSCTGKEDPVGAHALIRGRIVATSAPPRRAAAAAPLPLCWQLRWRGTDAYGAPAPTQPHRVRRTRGLWAEIDERPKFIPTTPHAFENVRAAGSSIGSVVADTRAEGGRCRRPAASDGR